MDKDYAGLVSKYSQKKKEIYRLQGNREAYVKQLWELALNHEAGDLEVYRELMVADVKHRYGYYPQEKRNSNLQLKKYFEEKMGKDIYAVVGKDETLEPCFVDK